MTARAVPDGGTGRAGPTSGRSGSAEVPVEVLLDLVAAAGRVGAGVPRTLEVVGRAAGGARGVALVAVAELLVCGAPWSEAWSGVPAELAPVAEALRAAWQDGVAPGPALRAAADQVRRDRQAEVLEAAARLGVRMVLPLGLCLLPAFVLLGVVPVVVSLVGGALG